ncbi:Uma2 family endonuclease [Streptomyces fuscigenes]|uniref:Uma2 family endonuclease n=1 Tax=Streptomyces fuscigenes TaxID=1528880 RepID=UPI001F46BA36|nr:Uma2 family endonuclease [Streptomyces fuscigenes]MCF3961780.1 Uma2 family endonuclease [Streptomyces fuscigenes]
MTAEPPGNDLSRWPVPPQDGYTVDDLFTLPELPPHTEMIDGSLVFASPQRRFHARVIHVLSRMLDAAAPEHLSVEPEMAVRIDRRTALEPDISVVRAEAVEGLSQTSFVAADVVLAIEVVSPESQARDRKTRPVRYAEAGIAHFWLVERAEADGHPVVHVYELDAVTRAYGLTGIHHDRLKTTVPFDIDIDISLDALRTL